MERRYFKCTSVRLMRVLYGLGFEKQSGFESDGIEYWNFEKSDDLQEALDFYFMMRKRLRNKTEVEI